MTPAQLRRIMPLAKHRADRFAGPLSRAMQDFEINTPARQAAFIAQLAHESGQLRYVKELASGAAYEGREDLGNTEAGDGVRYKGRGLIQITGRANYAACAAALGLDLVACPELLETTENAARSAAWFWHSKGLNELADKGDFRRLTKRINGGYNGYADRVEFWGRAQQVLS